MYWSSSNGNIELKMTLEQAKSCSHQGRCDDDVQALSEKAVIQRQLAKIPVKELADELKDYGAWDAEELADHEQNLQRILWIAASDIREEHNTKKSK